MSRPSRRTFLKRILAGMSTLCLPGLASATTPAWGNTQPITRDVLEQAFRELPKLPPAVAKPVPAAISLPFGTLPLNTYIRGPRYRVIFGRLDTPRFTAAVNEAVNKAAIDKAIASDYIIPYRVIPKGL